MRQYESVTVDDICDYLAKYWQDNPAIGELSRIADTLLESRVEEKVFLSFYNKIINDLKRIVPSIKSINSDIESSRWLEQLLYSQQLLTLAWQQANPRHVRVGHKQKEFADVVKELLKPSWQTLVEFQKAKPKEKSTWRKLLGN